MARGKNPRKELLVALVGLAVASAAAWAMRDRVRAVGIIALFTGGLSAGVALGVATTRFRATKNAPAP